MNKYYETCIFNRVSQLLYLKSNKSFVEHLQCRLYATHKSLAVFYSCINSTCGYDGGFKFNEICEVKIPEQNIRITSSI